MAALFCKLIRRGFLENFKVKYTLVLNYIQYLCFLSKIKSIYFLFFEVHVDKYSN